MDLEFDVVSNPEFLKEGNAVQDCLKPDRIVVGTDNVRTAELLKELYGPFTRTNHPVIVMDVRSAEMTKYAANAMLATKISFINEIANLCERVGADVDAVRMGMGADSRIGYQFLFPGVGYGGSCFPKDVKALIQTARKVGGDAQILEAVDDGEQPPEVGSGGEDPRPTSRTRDSTRPAPPWPSGAWPSSRTPTTCARPRASPSSGASWTPGWPCGPTTRWPETARPETPGGAAPA